MHPSNPLAKLCLRLLAPAVLLLAPAAAAPPEVVLASATQGPLAQVPVFATVTGQDAQGRFQRLDAAGRWHPCLPSDNTVPFGDTLGCAYSFPVPRGRASFPLDGTGGVAGGRLYLSFGAPLRLRVDPTTGGLVQPDPANPSDPNAGTRYDWVEFALDGTGFYGNTTCVDQFAVPITLQAVDEDGTATEAVGLRARRSDLMAAYQAAVPAPFQALADPLGLRITAPGHAAQGPLLTWFDGYLKAMWERYRSEPLVLTPAEGTFIGTVQAGGELAFTRAGDATPYLIRALPTSGETFRCDGVLAQGNAMEKVLGAQLAALLNRHLLQDPLDWRDPADYYGASPCNAYAAFWHARGLGHKAFGFPYDDVNDQSTLIQVAKPRRILITFRID